MKRGVFICILILYAINISLCKLDKIKIKSHKVITKNIGINKIEEMYDMNMGTSGAIMLEELDKGQIDFDLGRNYVIEKVMVTASIKKGGISFLVGNGINDDDGLLHNCSITTMQDVFECIPKCRSVSSERNGIVARKLSLILATGDKWATFYEIEVYSRQNGIIPGMISQFRLVKPDDCESKSWLLTEEKSQNKSLSHKSGTKILLEKSYIVTEVDVSFASNPPNVLELRLMNEFQKTVSISIELSKCSKMKSTYTCILNKSTFPVRVVEIVSRGISQLFLRGKTVYYPVLLLTTSKYDTKNLKLTCQYNQCDLSVHSNCSEETMKSGVQFKCLNNRLLRMSNKENSDIYTIIDQGKVENIWQNTKFLVETNENDKMIISMPRSYQYYGQYQCSCFIGDESQTDIKSNFTDLTAEDFLADIIIRTVTEYKMSDDPFQNATENMIIIPEKICIGFINVKILTYSLLKPITVSATYNGTQTETWTSDSIEVKNYKAFADNQKSWDVDVNEYGGDDLYPDCKTGNTINVTYVSKEFKIDNNFTVNIVKVPSKADNEKPIVIGTSNKKEIYLKTVFMNRKQFKIVAKEQTCLKTKTEVLTEVGNFKCVNPVANVRCYSYPEYVLIALNKARNIASSYKFEIIDPSTNGTLNSFEVRNEGELKESDVVIKSQYTDISVNSLNPKIKIVEVEIEFISKTVNDFIPCGKVILIINEENKPTKKTILQSSKYKLPVDMIKKSVSISITLEIEGMMGKYSTSITVTDPEIIGVEDIALQGESKLQLSWTGVDNVASNILEGYDVTIATSVTSCGDTKEKTIFVKKTDNLYGRNSFEFAVDSPSQSHSSSLIAYVQPVFKNSNKGPKEKVERVFEKIGKTKIILDDKVASREKVITIIPAQSDLPCQIKTINFKLGVYNLRDLVQDFSPIDKTKYKINNLIPGRKYNLTATVLYINGPSDKVSEVYEFETTDDITLGVTTHLVNAGERVNISCTADIGPDDGFRKIIEWRRKNEGPLPTNTRSEISQTKPHEAYLIMDKVLAEYSDIYECIVLPKGLLSKRQMNLVVNDLTVTPKNFRVDFTKNDPIQVKCFSSTVRFGNLSWIDSDGQPIPNSGNNEFEVKSYITTEEALESILTIKKPSLQNSGSYRCVKRINSVNAADVFTFSGEEKLEVTSLLNSSFIGETRKLRCTGTLAVKGQKVSWDINSLTKDNKNLIKTFYPNPADKTVEDLEIVNNLDIRQVSCKLLPSSNANGQHTTANYAIELIPKIMIHGPSNVTVGQSINLTCIGYPDVKGAKLQWVFYSDKTGNSTENREIELTTADKANFKSYEPMELTLSLKEVAKDKSGRYECKFKTSSRSRQLLSKSMSLSIKDNTLVGVVQPCTDCSKKSAHTILSRSIYWLLFIAFSLFFFF